MFQVELKKAAKTKQPAIDAHNGKFLPRLIWIFRCEQPHIVQTSGFSSSIANGDKYATDTIPTLCFHTTGILER